MPTSVYRIDREEYRTTCALVARVIPVLTWRHSGLGMLQAYVLEGQAEELRVHIWHDSLRREGIEESGLFHDHRFDLYSLVLTGLVHQAEHRLEESAAGAWSTHRVLHARAAAEANKQGAERLVDYHAAPTALPERYSLTTRVTTVAAGWAYKFPKREFHGTNFGPGVTVTLVTKSNQDDTPARILAPYGKPIVHAFEKPLPESAWARPISEAIAALEAVWQ